MTDTIDPSRRTAAYPAAEPSGGVTLMNKFVVPAGREQAFEEVWSATSEYFRGQQGFLSLRLHRALSPGEHYRYVNIARWNSLAAFQAAHNTEEFRRVVSRPEWQEFPSSPSLYEVVVEAGVDAGQPTPA